MRRCQSQILSLILSLGLAGLLSACVLAGAGPDGVTPNAVTGDDIEVTALDALPTAPGTDPAMVDIPPGADDGAKAQSAAPAAPVEAAVETPPEPAPQPDLAEVVAEVVAEVAPETVVPEVEKSDLQIACEKKKGNWSSAGGKSRICIFNTKDAGKQCTRESDCEGACLARSGSCSPIRPLLGCNEILQDDGARVTLCIN
jgi:hypothetical protein